MVPILVPLGLTSYGSLVFSQFSCIISESLLIASSTVEECFKIYEKFDVKDQEEIRKVLPTLISGMEMDLDFFRGESEAQLTALGTMDDLDTYAYRVAGCVGEFWTNLACAHLPLIRRQWDQEQKNRSGIRFGKGLQLTNILKDLFIKLL
mgnify:CR=1 FL=1